MAECWRQRLGQGTGRGRIKSEKISCFGSYFRSNMRHEHSADISDRGVGVKSRVAAESVASGFWREAGSGRAVSAWACAAWCPRSSFPTVLTRSRLCLWSFLEREREGKKTSNGDSEREGKKQQMQRKHKNRISLQIHHKNRKKLPYSANPTRFKLQNQSHMG